MQVPAEFLPRSWEMPPGARVLDESASVVAREFDGETLDWLVALVEIPPYSGATLLWMRPLDAKFDAGFVVLSQDYWAMGLEVTTEPFALRASLNTTWKRNRLARRILLNERGSLRCKGENAREAILFAADGMASWLVNSEGKDFYADTSAFRWNQPLTNTEFLRLSAREVWAQLQQLLEDPKNDAHFARRFARLSSKGRNSLIYDETRGTEEELKLLLRVRVHLQEDWNEMPQTMRLSVKADVSRARLYWDNYFRNMENFPKIMEEDVEQLLHWFRPMRSEMLNIPCVVTWLRNTEYLKLEVSRPTAHEQLEAQLRWREWLAQTQKQI